MWGLFKKKSKRGQLERRYSELMRQAHVLSTRDRKAADLRTAEAEEVRLQLDELILKERT